MASDKSLIFRTQIAFPLIGSSEKTEANPYNHLGEPALVQLQLGLLSCIESEKSRVEQSMGFINWGVSPIIIGFMVVDISIVYGVSKPT
jgi:hypothetical protein